ncbi:unnamed protein product [Psylliodes chrysocephalus]|uniref:Uncharacterized protein n=1 Tax=Psylliodes chrysocephalus TaxID=3402493 RepID=A0A9P0GBT2_9CUCU|nr:unnamed protein product [Psylliodes chrysocephala]
MALKFIQIVAILTIYKTFLVYADVEPLKSSDDLDPINDTENTENTDKEHEKRTIFNPTLKNVAWARHVAVKPSGAKFVLGYGPVDLKYKPVLRPIAIKHQGYHYNRPKIHFHLKRPIIHVPHFKPALQTEWKPIIKPVAVVKPAPLPAPVHVHPGAHVDQLHLNPVPHIDHIHKEPTVHFDHHHHPVQVAHVEHVHHISPAHLHHLQVPHVHAIPQAPLVPSSQLFEVTKPDLGVLPLGATFPTTAIKEIPAPQLIPQPLPSPIHVHPIAPIPHVHQAYPVTHLHPVHQVAPVHPVAPVQPVAPAIQFQQFGSIHPAHVGTIPHFQSPGHVFPLSPLPLEHVHHGDHIHPVGHLHPVDHIHHGNHIHPTGHLDAPHVHSVGHLHPVDHIHHGNHIHPTGHFEAPHVHSVEHFHPAGHFHSVAQPLPAPLPQPHVDYQEHPVQSLLPNHYHLQYPQIPHGTQHEEPGGEQHLYPHQQHVSLDAQHQLQYPQIPHGTQHEGPGGGQQLYPHQQHVPLDSQPHLQYPQIPQHEGPGGGQHLYPQQQHVPLDSQPHFQDAGQNVYQQQPPYQQDGNIQDHYPNQEDNRYQLASQVSSQHFVREGQFQIGDQGDSQGYVYQQPSEGRLIQPGLTDLQFPIQLPHHPAFDQDNRPEASQQNENVFRPSIQLEPPYKK